MNVYRKHPVITLGIGLLSFLTGMWLALSPSMEHAKQYAMQNELLHSIKHGEGLIHIDPAISDMEMDWYGEADQSAPREEAPVPQTDEPTCVRGIGILSIDRIGLRLPVVEGVSPAQLKVAVGWVPQTADIGAIGNAVIAGHRSYAHGQFFNRLGELIQGDTIHYESLDGDTMNFRITEILEMDPGDPAALYQPEALRQITLYTCTPIQTAERRLLIRAIRSNEMNRS